jgi:hypothetical protein
MRVLAAVAIFAVAQLSSGSASANSIISDNIVITSTDGSVIEGASGSVVFNVTATDTTDEAFSTFAVLGATITPGATTPANDDESLSWGKVTTTCTTTIGTGCTITQPFTTGGLLDFGEDKDSVTYSLTATVTLKVPNGILDVFFNTATASLKVSDTPVPPSLALFVTGLLGIAGLAWRRQKARVASALTA